MQIIITVNEDEGTATVERREGIQKGVEPEREDRRSSSGSAFESEQLIDVGGPPETAAEVTDPGTGDASSPDVREGSSSFRDRSSSYPGTMIDEFGEEQLGSAVTEQSEAHARDVGPSPSLPEEDRSSR